MHGGMLQRNAPEETNTVDKQLGAERGIAQNAPEEEQEDESVIETQDYCHFAGNNQGDELQAKDEAGGQTELTQDTGQKQEDIATQKYTDFQILDYERKGSRTKSINKRATSDNEDEEYPG
eukprot:2653159-Heterocapsa_arctica.AAC.1